MLISFDHTFVIFILTALIINLTPGVAMLFVINVSQRHGLKAGILGAFGVEVGTLFYVLLVAFFGSILTQYPTVYNIIRYVGAIYLLYLAYGAWPRQNVEQTLPSLGKPIKPLYQKNSIVAKSKKEKRFPFIKGLLINLTNPKIGLFFASLLPQFIPAHSTHSVTLFLVYGLIFNIGGMIVNLIAALLATRIASFSKKGRWFQYIPSFMFTFIAIKIIF